MSVYSNILHHNSQDPNTVFRAVLARHIGIETVPELLFTTAYFYFIMNGLDEYSIVVELGTEDDLTPDNNDIYSIRAIGGRIFLHTETDLAIDFNTLQHTNEEVLGQHGMDIGSINQARDKLYRLFRRYSRLITNIYVLKNGTLVYEHVFTPQQGSSSFGASGVGSPWGMSPRMVAGLDNSLDYGNTHLTGQLGMTSTPLGFDGTVYTSPLTVQNKSHYTAFGRVKSALQIVNQEISYLKRT
jgi:hypothetical protein